MDTPLDRTSDVYDWDVYEGHKVYAVASGDFS